MEPARTDYSNGQAADAAFSSRLARPWKTLRRVLRILPGRRVAVEPDLGESPGGSSQSGWIPFDEQRRSTEFRRADIVFGPDMFDPRTDNGDRPLTRAMHENRSAVDPDDLTKTVGEVFGRDATSAEIRERVLENARSIELESPPQS